jgi:hypothetical protein
MKMQWSIGCLVIGMLACARVPVASKAVRPAVDYYPLAVGNRWTYETRMLGEVGVRPVEITAVRDGFYVDSAGGALLADAYGVRDQKRYLLREPVEKGNAWTNVVSVSSTERYEISDVGFPCDAPAGRFESCARVVSKNRIDDKTTLVNEVTFAPGVGIVRVEVFAERGRERMPQTVLVLKEYQLATGAAGR